MVQATEIFMELIKRLMLIFTVQWHSDNTAITPRSSLGATEWYP